MSFQTVASRLAGVVLLVLAAGMPVRAATTPQQASVDAITRAMEAVVGLEVTAADDARSAETLGKEREGSGVVIGPDGLILTIGYLILEADSIQVRTHDNRVIPARAVGYDQATGFGLVRSVLPLRGIQPVTLGVAKEAPLRGALLAATGGEDGGMGLTQLVGIRPFSGYWEYHIDSALFTSPPLRNHSGAPLFNQRGELLGIGSLFVGNALGDAQQVPGNMFVPVDLLKPILPEMQQTGSTRVSRRPWLGLSSTEQGGRIRIVRVNRDSPAQDAGLVVGDFVLAIDGEKVTTLEGFYKKLWARPEPESEVQLTVLHGAEVLQVTVRAVDRMKTIRKPAGI
ncbi:serine protease [Ramlibacter sp. USB13]|uniref:Serine protease n=1 Tax=Ramlibacter cellulosilyticus TaxID=2764187 RepID=A0A923MP90_9BURK|nr:S1C family serine protease [Ramlibacter cellulosilyticus]MBC5781714.1 serine protease [Ramlibacter cellulosilyticus]